MHLCLFVLSCWFVCATVPLLICCSCSWRSYRKILIGNTNDQLSFVKHVGVRLKLPAKQNLPALYSVALILLLFRIWYGWNRGLPLLKGKATCRIALAICFLLIFKQWLDHDQRKKPSKLPMEDTSVVNFLGPLLSSQLKKFKQHLIWTIHVQTTIYTATLEGAHTTCPTWRNRVPTSQRTGAPKTPGV